MRKRTPETIHTSLGRILPLLGERAQFLERMAPEAFSAQPVQGNVKSDGTVYAVLNGVDSTTSFSYAPGPGVMKNTKNVINLSFGPAIDQSITIECGEHDDEGYYATAQVFSYQGGGVWGERVDEPDLVARLAANLVGQARRGIAQREQNTGYTCVGENRQSSVARYALELLKNVDNRLA